MMAWLRIVISLLLVTLIFVTVNGEDLYLNCSLMVMPWSYICDKNCEWLPALRVYGQTFRYCRTSTLPTFFEGDKEHPISSTGRYDVALDFSDSNITTIVTDAFKGFSAYALLLQFTITTLLPFCFAQLTTNMIIIKSNDELLEVHPDIFQQVHNLTDIDFSDNPNLGSLPDDLFRELSILKDLNLEYNGLTSLHVRLFEDLRRLQRLNLEGNLFESIPNGIFRHLGELRYLNLAILMLKELHVDIFQGLGSLRELNFAYNEIEVLQTGIFRGLVNLEQLKMQQNKISELNNDIFVGLVSLKLLDITDNSITCFYFDVFHPLRSLELLKMSQKEQESGLCVMTFDGMSLRVENRRGVDKCVAECGKNVTGMNLIETGEICPCGDYDWCYEKPCKLLGSLSGTAPEYLKPYPGWLILSIISTAYIICKGWQARIPS